MPENKRVLRKFLKKVNFAPIWLGYLKMDLVTTLHGSNSEDKILKEKTYFGSENSLRKIPKHLWNKGEPDNKSGNESCTSSVGKNQIRDVNCEENEKEKRAVICVRKTKKNGNENKVNKVKVVNNVNSKMTIPKLSIPSVGAILGEETN